MSTFAPTQSMLLFLLSVPLWYLLFVILGRHLKRQQRVPLGAMYYVFSLAVSVYLAARLLSVELPMMREIAAVAILSAGFVVNALIKRYVWEVQFTERREAPVPKLLSDAIALLIICVALVVVICAVYRIRIPGLLTGSGIVAIILGLALQDLLGNIIAGFAIHFGQPFRAGDWLQVNERRAQVMEINWRSTRLRTADDVLLDIPNRELVRQTIVNYHYPTTLHSLRLSVPVDYSAPPTRVKDVLIHAAANAKGVLPEPRIRAFLKSYGEYFAEYEVQFWINDNAIFNEVNDAVRTNIWYGLQRHGIRIALPVRNVRIERPSRTKEQETQAAARSILRQQPLFKTLSDIELDGLLPRGRTVHFGRGEKLIEQGTDGDSMFILVEGDASVVVNRNGFQTHVASLRSGDCFGEMSLLTGEKRSATVIANTDCEAVEIGKPVLARSLKENPDLLNKLSELLAQRQLENEGALATGAPAAETHGIQSAYKAGFLRRLRRFLEL
jgi:small-conductance mechanosensitive channel/CRP-like cAMP-binding protein